MEPREALEEAIKAWRKHKHPRFAVVADWATSRALREPRPALKTGANRADVAAWNAVYEKGDILDFPRLMTAVRAGKSQVAAERITLLSKLDDPRFVNGVLAVLEAPPFTARTAMPFFRTCASELAKSGDLRVRSALEDLASRYKAIVTTTVSDDIAALLRRTAGEIDQVKPGPLSAAIEKKLASLEALFENELATQSRKRTEGSNRKVSDDGLLAAIYAAPNDDAPRLVFADTLIERGDPRGDFISLQLTRARGAATAEGLRRERELISGPKRKSEWSLPLSQGGEAHLDRGFPDSLSLDPRSMKTVVGLPALRTVTRVDGFNRAPPIKHTNALLFHENARHLKSAGTFPRELFDALTGELHWEETGLSFAPTAEDFARLPNVKKLALHHPWGNTPQAAAFAGMSRLKSLECWGPTSPDPALWAALPHLEDLHLRASIEPSQLKSVLAPLKKLKTFTIEWVPTPDALPASIVDLSVRWQVDLPLAALLDALPALKNLEVMMNHASGPSAAAILSAGAARLARLSRLDFGGYIFAAPFTPNGELTIRQWDVFGTKVERTVSVLNAVPPDCVRRVVVRPHTEDPTRHTPPAPSDEDLAALRKSCPAIPIDVEWY